MACLLCCAVDPAQLVSRLSDKDGLLTPVARAQFASNTLSGSLSFMTNKDVGDMLCSLWGSWHCVANASGAVGTPPPSRIFRHPTGSEHTAFWRGTKMVLTLRAIMQVQQHDCDLVASLLQALVLHTAGAAGVLGGAHRRCRAAVTALSDKCTADHVAKLSSVSLTSTGAIAPPSNSIDRVLAMCASVDHVSARAISRAEPKVVADVSNALMHEIDRSAATPLTAGADAGSAGAGAAAAAPAMVSCRSSHAVGVRPNTMVIYSMWIDIKQRAILQFDMNGSTVSYHVLQSLAGVLFGRHHTSKHCCHVRGIPVSSWRRVHHAGSAADNATQRLPRGARGKHSGDEVRITVVLPCDHGCLHTKRGHRQRCFGRRVETRRSAPCSHRSRIRTKCVQNSARRRLRCSSVSTATGQHTALHGGQLCGLYRSRLAC